MSRKNYLDFTSEEFATDTCFQNWVLQDNRMTNLFWKKWLADNPEKQADIDLAIKLIKQFTFKDYQASDDDFNEVWRSLKENQSIFLSKKALKKRWYAVAAVASIVLLISVSVFNRKTLKNNTPIIVNNTIEVGVDKAILTLENGENIALKKGQNYVKGNVKSDGEKVVYKAENKDLKKIAYNYITVPTGGQFQITLSDGTKIWLNSESQLKYPVRFKDGEPRQVDLVYGEAYFDVSPSTAHKGTKFKVFNQAQEVEVLGTQFNIKAYKDEAHVYTTLVEGEVAINTKDRTEILKPNQQLSLNLTNNNVVISEVDVYREASWKDGVFSFKNKSLKDIMKVLSRWYKMEVIFKNKALENVTFNGSLEKKLDVIDILSILDTNYEINDKTVTLK